MPDAPMRALTTPFPRAQQEASGPLIEPMKEPQHRIIVKTIKTNRAKRNLDFIHTHDAKLRYEAVWVQSDQGMWMCCFGLEIYDWIDLGDAGIQQRRGCAGCYALLAGGYPASATRGKRIKRWKHERVLDAMQVRLDRRPDAMGVRRQTIEHPFGTIKAWMGSTHFLTRTLKRVRTEMSLHILAYNIKRVIAIIGVGPLLQEIRA